MSSISLHSSSSSSSSASYRSPLSALSALLDVLQCTLCAEQYDTNLHSPKIFCHHGHTFCLSCCREWTERSKPHVNCPSCATEVKTPDDIENGWSSNVVVLDAVDALRQLIQQMQVLKQNLVLYERKGRECLNQQHATIQRMKEEQEKERDKLNEIQKQFTERTAQLEEAFGSASASIQCMTSAFGQLAEQAQEARDQIAEQVREAREIAEEVEARQPDMLRILEAAAEAVPQLLETRHQLEASLEREKVLRSKYQELKRKHQSSSLYPPKELTKKQQSRSKKHTKDLHTKPGKSLMKHKKMRLSI